MSVDLGPVRSASLNAHPTAAPSRPLRILHTERSERVPCPPPSRSRSWLACHVKADEAGNLTHCYFLAPFRVPRVLRNAVIVGLAGSATTSTTELKRPQL